MIAAVDKVKKILESQFEIKSYVELVKEVFASVKIIAPDSFRKEFSNFSSHIKSSSHVGSYEDSDGKRLAIFAVELKKDAYVERSRSTQRSFAKKLIENGSCDAAFIAFFTEGDSKWRLSFVRLDYEMKLENGKLKAAENITPAKRYSYLVGEKEPSYTAIDRFRSFIIDNDSHPKLNEIEDAFSVEKVTNEFFDLYLEKFLELKEHLDDNDDFVMEANQHNFTSAQFAKKLMGQIVFLYFLQKKGWLGVGAWPTQLNEKEYKNAYFAKGAKSRELIPIVYNRVVDDMYKISAKGLESISDTDEEVLASCVKGKPWGSGPHDFMRRLFTQCVKKEGSFFEDYLEPLFYDALNINRGESGYCPTLHCRIPFLSGGLFEPIDGYEWKYNTFDIPNSIFSNKRDENDVNGTGILDIFDRYNFTISEDEPLEKEVAIDPEMLGKIFENLLEIQDRKSKGAFYTPREIVHYMCQESLINHITNKTGIDQEDIREFIIYGDFMKDEDTVKEKRAGNNGMCIPESIFKVDVDGIIQINKLADIDSALETVKVADPAVGSGAFPLGMLNEIVRARENISAYMGIGMNAAEIRMMYSFERHPYNLKLNAIQNSIFAVDIEPSAVDIAQLRLWLALVIDDEINPEATSPLDGHKNPIPLPNLECNILCGNSLIEEFEGTQLVNANELLGTKNKDGQHNIFQSSFDSVLPKLIDAQNRLFRCADTNKKAEIKLEIESIRDIIIHTQMAGSADKEKLMKYEETKKMASKPFILWQLDFAKVFIDNGGFDIVIGNPPYGLLNKKQNQNTSILATDSEIDIYKSKSVYAPAKGGMINIYRLFICKSFDLLRKEGHMSLIFPMAFMCDLSAYNLRKYIFDNQKIEYIEAFPERDNENKRVFKSAKMSVCILGANKRKSQYVDAFPMRISWDKYVDLSSPKVLISAEDIEMIDDKSLTIPLVTPNELLIMRKMCNKSIRMKEISKCYTGEIDLSLDKKYVHLEPDYSRLLRGAQVQKFYITDNISQGDILFIDDKKYLNEVNSPRSKHHELRRIIMQGITGINEKYRLKMTIADKGIYCANSVNYLLLDENMEYILGLCNSNLLNWFFAKLSTNSNVNGYEIDNLPIKIADNKMIEKVTSIVEKITKDIDKNENVKCLNNCVYEIYELSDEDISEIEKTYER